MTVLSRKLKRLQNTECESPAFSFVSRLLSLSFGMMECLEVQVFNFDYVKKQDPIFPVRISPLYGLTVKSIVALQGPVPAPFQVSIHHLAAPEASTAAGVIEQVPVPEGQPASAAVYHC
jgi:hypothetical protein